MKNPWDQITKPQSDVSAIRASAEHPLDLFWGKDDLGRYMLIYEYPNDSDIILTKIPVLEGVEAITSTDRSPYARLILRLHETADWELFLVLCNDIIEYTSKLKRVKSGSDLILNRLNRWHEFLKKKRSDILSEEQIKGLIGELHFLKNYMIPTFGVEDSIRFWTGPLGSSQDFIVNNACFEIKCRIGNSKPYIRISSVNQLYTELKHLYLYVLTLSKSTESNEMLLSLPGLVSALSAEIIAVSHETNVKFNDLLMEAGYIKNERYDEYRYVLVEDYYYRVYNDFPRIMPGSIVAGISAVKYDLDLLSCGEYMIDKSEVVHD